MFIAKRKYERRYREYYACCDAYVALCPAYCRRIAERLGIRDTVKLHAIGNGQPPAAATAGKGRTVLYVGRLSYSDKRVDRLLTIWHMAGAATGGWRLVIVGEGQERERLERQAAALQLSNVTFAGFCSSPQKYYDEGAVLCLTSTFESWGLVLTEAQANGVVPIAFGCSEGVRSILSEGGGVCIEPFDMGAYADALAALLTDDDRRCALQRSAKAKSLEYSPEKIGEAWCNLLETLAAKE